MCSSVFLFLLTGFCREQLETPMPVLIPTVAQGWIPRACPHTFLSSSSCHEHHELYLLSLCLSKESPRLAVLGTSHQAPPYLGALELLWNVLSATFLPTLLNLIPQGATLGPRHLSCIPSYSLSYLFSLTVSMGFL